MAYQTLDGIGNGRPGRLLGKTILVTGAGSGIGRRIARRFCDEGATVVFTDRDLDAARASAEGLDRASVLRLDVADEDSVREGFAQAASIGRRPDVVVANAGVQLFGRDTVVGDLDLDVWQQTLAVNLTGAFLTVKHAVRAMLGDGGSIILTGSPTGLTGTGADCAAYSASKAGVHGLTRAAAAAYASRGIRVNTVVPGYTETPLVAAISTDAAERAAAIAKIPLGRAGTAADVEGVMVFLASDESSFATGSIFRVDGGATSL